MSVYASINLFLVLTSERVRYPYSKTRDKFYISKHPCTVVFILYEKLPKSSIKTQCLVSDSVIIVTCAIIINNPTCMHVRLSLLLVEEKSLKHSI